MLAAESGWDKVALQRVFMHGLGYSIKDAFVARDETDNLDSLISLSIHLDNYLRERRREKLGHLQAPSSRPPPQSPSRVSPDAPSSHSPHSSAPLSSLRSPCSWARLAYLFRSANVA